MGYSSLVAPGPAGPWSALKLPLLALVAALCFGLGLCLSSATGVAALFSAQATQIQNRPLQVMPPMAVRYAGAAPGRTTSVAQPQALAPAAVAQSQLGAMEVEPVLLVQSEAGSTVGLLGSLTAAIAAFLVVKLHRVPREWAMMATSGEKTSEESPDAQAAAAMATDSAEPIPMPLLKLEWERVGLFCASPLLLTPLAAIAVLVFHTNVLGASYVLDAAAISAGCLWALPWVALSLLPLEKLPGLGVLDEINQCTKFIGMISFGVEKNATSLGKVVFATLLLSLAAGIGEELVFRGALQGGLVQLLTWAGTPAGAVTVIPLLVSSVIFGLLHSYSNSPVYAIVASLAGGWFGWCYQSTGNIIIPMAAHTLVDWISFFAVHLQVAWFSTPEEQKEVWNLDAPIAKQFREAFREPPKPKEIEA